MTHSKVNAVEKVVRFRYLIRYRISHKKTNNNIMMLHKAGLSKVLRFISTKF